MTRNKLLSAIILFFVVQIALLSCSASSYGKLKSNKEVTRAFETYHILPDHKYYYRGASSRPTVVAGINQNYSLNLKLWVEINPKSKDFRILIDRVSNQVGGATHPWGFTILDPSGKNVGVWYSALGAATVKINENGEIVILSPVGIVTIGNQM